MDQNKACSQQRWRDVPKKRYIPKGGNTDWIKSTYERRVENRGRNKGDHGFKGRPNRHWMMVSIQASVSSLICQFFANFMLALIVLSSITKKGEIVTNMAPFIPFRVILVIE